MYTSTVVNPVTHIESSIIKRFPPDSYSGEFYTRDLFFKAEGRSTYTVSIIGPTLHSLLLPGENPGDVEVKLV